MTKGFKDSDGKFRPTENQNKNISKDKIEKDQNISSKEFSKAGKKELKIEIEEDHSPIGNISAEIRKSAEEKIGSKIKKHTYGNEYEFENGETYLIFRNQDDAHDQAMEYMENLWDDIGISAWNQDFASQFADEQLVEIAFEQVKEHNDYKLARNEKLFDEDNTKEDLFKASLEADGLGHTLAGYDGEEIELTGNALMYRTN